MIRHYEPTPTVAEKTNARPVSLPCEPWETPIVKREKQDREKALSQHRSYIQERLCNRRAQVRRLIAQGKTRTEIRQAMPGMTRYILEKDISAIGLPVKSERGTK